MNDAKIYKRINTLISRLESNKDVSRRSIERVVGENGMRRFDNEWRKEKALRGKKPKKMVHYSNLLKIANIQYAKAETSSSRKRNNAKKLFEKADLMYEAAYEYLKESVVAEPELRLWLDRDPEINGNFQNFRITHDPEGMPRPIWQIPGLAKKCGLTQLSIRDLKIAALHQALETSFPEPQALDDLDLFRTRKRKNLDFSGFIF